MSRIDRLKLEARAFGTDRDGNTSGVAYVSDEVLAVIKAAAAWRKAVLDHEICDSMEAVDAALSDLDSALQREGIDP